MDNNRAIQPVQPHPPAAPRNVQELIVLAEQFAKSGYFSDARQAAQAVVKIQYGLERGIGPATAMMGVHIVQGKPTPSATMMAALIKSSGKYNYRVRTLSDTECTLDFFELGQDVGSFTYTWKQAEKAKLTSKEVWQAYPQNMLFSRAISSGAKIYCPDIFMGAVYTPEELDADIDGETGEIIEGTAREVQPAVFAPEPEPVVAATEQQINAIYDLVSALEKDAEEVAASLGVTTFRDLPTERANRVISRLTTLVNEQRAQEAQETTPELFAGDPERTDYEAIHAAAEKRSGKKEARA